MADRLKEFIQYLNRKVMLDSADRVYLSRNLLVKTFQKYQVICPEGEISRAFYFNLDGFVRLFYNVDGKEKTAYFYPPGHFISDYESFVHQVPSRFNLQATEPTTLVEISQTAAAQLLAFSPKFEVLARIAMEEELMTNQKIIAALITQSATQRYHQLLADHAEIFQRVPQRFIASYLGIEPESLSRIKKRAHTRKS